MKVHFIAIGGSAMHNLAMALHKKGFTVSGSDDEIFEPSKSRLEKYGLLPDKIGWSPEYITTELDAIILGMHARADNPELIRARELGIKIYSYPEYIYEQCKDKKRVVIGGSHGKTTITSMIMHVLNFHGINHDYMVGALLEGFETMVKLSDDAKIAVFEGDEYLSSPIDRRPKFHLYKPDIALISGIAWDHINVFPTFEIYKEQFSIFIEQVNNEGALIYCNSDDELCDIVNKSVSKVKTIGYSTHKHNISSDSTSLVTDTGEIPILVFGDHNLQNINGAKLVCNEISITDQQFYDAIVSFKGASKRLQLLSKNSQTNVFLDFAHSPSKLQATTKAVKEQFKNRELVACMELHTFSSLTKEFLNEYMGSMEKADIGFVYYNPQTIKHKKLKEITPEQVREAFGGTNIRVFIDSEKLTKELLKINWQNKNLLLMSSGNFSGINYQDFAEQITSID